MTMSSNSVTAQTKCIFDRARLIRSLMNSKLRFFFMAHLISSITSKRWRSLLNVSFFRAATGLKIADRAIWITFEERSACSMRLKLIGFYYFDCMLIWKFYFLAEMLKWQMITWFALELPSVSCCCLFCFCLFPFKWSENVLKVVVAGVEFSYPRDKISYLEIKSSEDRDFG